MRLLVALLILITAPSVYALYSAGIDKLMQEMHSVEIMAVDLAVKINPLGRIYAHEIAKVDTPEGIGYLIRVADANYKTKTYLVDQVSNFTFGVLDHVYVIQANEIQPKNSMELHPNFAAVCVSRSQLNGVRIDVFCYRATEVMETRLGVNVK